MQRARFEEQKALATILYVAHQLGQKSPERRADLYKLLKVLYFADKKHLARYNRAISGDFYVAMGDGPVPSRIYDMLKFIRRDGYFTSATPGFTEHLKAALQFSDHITVIPTEEPDLEELSESDIECLDEAIDQHRAFTFGQLKAKSHDEAYNSADYDNCISFEEIAKSGGADETMVGYVRNWLENQNFSIA
jgi:uncharacterized phage-associated protein